MTSIEFASMILSGLEKSLTVIVENSSYHSDKWKLHQLNNLIMIIAELCKDEICDNQEPSVCQPH